MIWNPHRKYIHWDRPAWVAGKEDMPFTRQHELRIIRSRTLFLYRTILVY